MTKSMLVNYEGKPCYNIEYRSDFSDLADLIVKLKGNLNKYGKICIVTDDKVADLYLNEVSELLKNTGAEIFSFIFPNGEASKKLSTIEKLYEELIINHFVRSDLLIALGGGVVGDMTGFAAATYLRGIDFVQIPTTLLSQVDSSVGGKTGVDLNAYKNMIGAFYMPKLVYMNISTLKTLDDVQFACGMAEVIKYGFIKDKDFLTWLCENRNEVLALKDKALLEVVYRSCDWKRIVVENDPKEKGERALLNFGHTIGHAIEKLSDFKLFHGQCVAVGMAAAGEISLKKGLISKDDLEGLKKIIESYNLPLKAEVKDANEVLKATKSDKKMTSKSIKFILLEGIGNGIISENVSDEDLLFAIESVSE